MQLTKEQILELIHENEISRQAGENLLEKIKKEEMLEGSQKATVQFYGSSWVAKEAKKKSAAVGTNGLVFDNTGLLYQQVLQNVTEKNCVYQIVKGKSFSIEENHKIILNPENMEDYDKLFTYLKKENCILDFIIHDWTATTFEEFKQEGEAAFYGSIFSVLEICKQIIKRHIKEDINFSYLYRHDELHCCPQAEAVGAFARTVRYETPNILMKHIEVVGDQACQPGLVNLLVQETGKEEVKEVLVKFDKKQRYVKRHLEEELERSMKEKVIDQEGCIFITGGLGGLGSGLAEYLGRRLGNPIVVTGRKDNETASKILKEKGLENCTYYQMDVADEVQVKECIQRAVKEYGKIVLLVHSAGILHDKFIFMKELNEFKTVIEPKIAGTIHLIEACKETAFPSQVVFFSSVAGIMGNIGQCDYSYGNAFMDAYSRMLHEEGKSIISINWPLWKDGGMMVDEAQVENYKQQSQQELLPMTVGWDAMMDLLSGGRELTQCFVSYAKKHTLAAFINNERLTEKKESHISETEKKDLLEKIEEYLKDIFSKVLELDPEEISLAVSFEEYGIDSLLVTRVNSLLGEQIGGLSKTILYEYKNLYELSKYLLEYKEEDLVFLLEDEGAKGGNAKKDNALIDWSDYEQSYSVTETHKTETKGKESKPVNDIAIIGISGRYPKADSLEEFWNNLLEGRDCVDNGPEKRWGLERFYGGTKERPQPGKSYCKYGGFLDEPDMFDAAFFRISPREAEMLDPQERMFLENVQWLLEDACYSKHTIEKATDGKNDVGVFVGVTSNTYSIYEIEEAAKQNYVLANSSEWSIANRVSYIMDFHGPSMAIDTACSSSLTALNVACDSLKNGECSMAIAGGVNLYLHPEKYIQLCQSRMLSPTGKCHSFSVNGDGFVPGEGVGALLLKPLDQAVKDGDHIYAVIKGTSINHGGKTNGYSVPNPVQQAEVIAKAIENSGISADKISYVEAHGTGTVLGDPIEVEGLSKAFSRTTGKKQFCLLGSVKSNIGHGEAVAGIAGLTKIILQMQHNTLVPSIHAEQLNPNIDFTKTPFELQRVNSYWEPIDGRRIAGISSFGAGGSNAHIIIEQYNEGKTDTPVDQKEEKELILLSARSKHALVEEVKQLQTLLKKNQKKNSETVKEIEENIRTELQHILHIQPEMVEEDASFEELGLGAVEWNQLSNYLSKTYGQTITDSDAGKFYGVSDLVQAIAEENQSIVVNEEETEQFGIKDVAFSLMRGKDDMEVRTAFLASSIEELEQLLNKFLSVEESRKIDTVANMEEHLIEYQEQKGNPFFVQQMLEERDLEGLEKEWRKGRIIDWDMLYEAQAVKQVPVPKYSFERKHHWVKIVGGEQQKTGDFTEEERTGDHGVFSTVLTGNEFFLVDHNHILPAAVFLEFARKVVVQFYAMKAKEMKNVTFLEPFIIMDRTKLKYECNLKGNELAFQVKAGFEAGNVKVYAKGILVFGDLPEAERKQIPLAQIENRAMRGKVVAEEYYNKIDELHAHAGERLKGLKEFHLEANRAAGIGVLKTEMYQQFEKEFIWHPALLDGGIRTADCLGLLLYPKAEKLHIPFSIDKLKVYSYDKPICYAYIEEVKEWSDEERDYDKWNIMFADENGKVLFEFQNYVSKRITIMEENQAQKQFDDVEEGILIWEKDEIILNQSKLSEQVLLFIKQKNGSSGFVKELESSFKEVVQRDGENLDWLANMDVNQVPDYIVYEVDSVFDGMHENYLREGVNSGILALHKIVKKLNELSRKEKRILVLFRNGAFGINPIYAALSGVARTLALEMNSCKLKVCGMEDSLFLDKQKLAELVKAELAEETFAKEVSYIDGRKTRKYKECTIETNKDWKVDGTILIAGTGALGLYFAEYFAKNYNTRVVCIGRSALAGTRKEKIDQMKAQGLQIEYASCDVCDSRQVEVSMKEIAQKFGPIKGVLYTAGVIFDSMFEKKTVETMEAVVKPKVFGSFNMIEAVKNYHPDFIVLFSSTSSVFGNLGQADYSYGNSFMDGEADYYNQILPDTKVVSINWPIWKDGAMKVEENLLNEYKDTIGMVPLELEQGMVSFQHALLSNESRFIVMQGVKEKIKNYVENQVFPSKANRVQEQKSERLESESEGVFAWFCDQTESLIGEVLHMPKEEVKPQRNISELGFDSIIFSDLSDLMNDTLLIDTTPAMFFGHATILELEQFVYQKFANKLEAEHAEQKIEEPCVENNPEAHSIEETIWSKDKEVKTEEMNPYEGKVAIIGMSGCFPKSDDLEQFWDHIVAGEDLITEIPKDRWDYEKYYGTDLDKKQTTRKWGGFMNEIDKFDPLFFHITPKDAVIMDPQERLLIETVYHTMEDAGYRMSDISGSDTGIYIGISNSDYKELLVENDELIAMTNSTSINRVSYLFNLHGESFPIDTACSSSLVAIAKGVEAITSGKSKMAFAGGVNVITCPNLVILQGRANMLSPNGRCATFDEAADGYVRGEGVGVLLLKDLRAAVEDRDMIYGVIQGTGINHGGHGSSLTAPNVKAQAALLKQVYQDAKIDVRDVSMIETHGTGTKLGDPIEMEALKDAFSELMGQEADRNYCAIQAVKTNIGHLESASGVAGVIKVLLAMKNKKIPKVVHFNKLNPFIQLEDSPFYVPTETKEWKQLEKNGRKIPRIAGISSFGIGGVNAHVVIQEREDSRRTENDFETYLLPLSADNMESLRCMVAELAHVLEQKTEFIQDIAYTLQVAREQFPCRVAFLGKTIDVVLDEMKKFLEEKECDENRLYTESEKILASSQRKNSWQQEALETYKGAYQIGLAFVDGGEIDFKQLYLGKEENKRRVSLPGYSFKKERYWFRQDNKALQKVRKLHPLIDENTSTLREQKYRIHLEKDAYYLKDHVVMGQSILPGAVMTEILCAAATLALDAPVYCLHDIRFHKAVVYDEMNPDYDIVVIPQETSAYIKIRQLSDEIGEIIYTDGYCDLAIRNQPSSVEVDIAKIEEQLTQELPCGDLYEKYEQLGMQLGTSFQTIYKIEKNDNSALTSIKLPAQRREEREQYHFHPSLLDGALQSIVGLLASDKAVKKGLPYEMKELNYYRKPTETCFVYVVEIKQNTYEIAVINENGELAAMIKEYSIREIPL